MPLVRCTVRNEYSLGLPELYKEANREDPKAILDGVAVAGLVGILRQLGDLAEFAAEVFHGLQEQVTTTASRSHKLAVRVQCIEAALPPLEKAVLSQTSHLHFCYTAGSDWHPRIRNEQNHFIYNDLPRFIMDSYEECRDPPRLHLLDKFDSGGPGSCLKRYSDPTYFKRVSASSGEANTEKAQRDKKSRKIKKKRSWQRNGEVLQGASILNGSGRMQFSTPSVHGQASPREASICDTTLKSDRGNQQSYSFDSRTGSGYIECVFDLNSSMQPEEPEPKESSLKMQHSDTPDSSIPDEQTRVDDFPHCSLQGEATPSSSCVSWEEKTEIVEPNDQKSDSSDETPEMLPTNSCIDTPEGGAINLKNVVDHMNILFDAENIPRSISGGNQLDEIESETDNYMDALNTIESESETDFDCQTKQEVEQYVPRGDHMLEIDANDADHHPSHLDSHSATYNFTDKVMSCDLPNSVPLEFVHAKSPEIVGKPDPGTSPGTDNDNILEASLLESVISDPSSSGSKISNSQDPFGDKFVSSVCKSQESPVEFSGFQSNRLWTNGGLLGLEPSKPPDFVTRSKDDNLSTSGYPGRPNILVNNSPSIEENSGSKCSTSHDNDLEGGTFDKKTSGAISPANLEVKFEKFGDSHHNTRFNHTRGCSLNEASIMTPGTELPVIPDVKSTSADTNQDNDENSSRMFGLGQKLLVNGFRRKLSLVHDEKSEPVSSVKSGVTYQTFSETVLSPSSSPPLEHMKISFHPMNGFETSKLKLKFPDGSHFQEYTRELLPSFQLVPELASPLHDIGADSDDDTFCRSSPYMSDDCHSQHSESNSEQWEFCETPRSKNSELYDSLCIISSAGSILTSPELEGTPYGSNHIDENGKEPYQSGPLLDLPSFDAVNSSLLEEKKHDSAPMDLLALQYPMEPTPPPPPLPPPQWRSLKPDSGIAEENQDVISEPLSHAFDLEQKSKPDSTRQQEHEPNSTKQQQQNIVDAVASALNSKQDHLKFNRKKETNQASNVKELDEKEDFLHQIRTKSFNLRRTVPAKPTITPAPTTNIKVSAILEKANAIRQAVGSDDDDGEDDDKWSDT